MQNIQLRIFEGVFSGNLKAEQRSNALAAFLVLLQVGMLLYLVITNGFAYSFLGLYLLHLLGFGFLLGQLWLDRNPDYLRHFTLSDAGVRYRAAFLKREEEFDWAEVDEISVLEKEIHFYLKNDEKHLVHLDMAAADEALRQARNKVRVLAQQHEITLKEYRD